MNIDEQFAQVNAKIDALTDALTKALDESEGRIVERMREMQTEILRAFDTEAENQ